MVNQIGRDVARQVANVAGAIFHIVAGMILTQGEMPGEDITLIQPSNYAFIIWGPIFLLCLAYAVYQALPANRERLLLRRTGWFTAGAFFLNGVLVILASPERFVVTEGLVVIMLLCLAVAYVRLMRSDRGALGGADRWLVVLPVGLFFGWITAATVLGAAQVLVFLGQPVGSLGGALSGAALLFAGGLFASAALMAGRSGPPQGSLAYAGAALWAFLGIVTNQYDASLITTSAAVVCAAIVALALLGVPGGGGQGRIAGRGTVRA